jgi:rRNA maturation protein Nop10
MRPIRFETADGPERTQIGEGLTRLAAQADRLETGRAEGKYALRHDDGCAVCGAAMTAGEPFYFDPDTGEIRCERHGADRRGDA